MNLRSTHPSERYPKERQSPAHSIAGNYLNAEFWQDQDRHVTDAYRASHALREFLSALPGAESHQPAVWLKEQRIKVVSRQEDGIKPEANGEEA